jgi:hypothetical protein
MFWKVYGIDGFLRECSEMRVLFDVWLKCGSDVLLGNAVVVVVWIAHDVSRAFQPERRKA